MIVKPDTETIAKNVEPGMVIDIARGRDLSAEHVAVYGVSANEDTREVELVDHRGTPTILPADAPVVVRGYFNVD